MAGHTPGHSGFLLESNGERLLFWGDIIHLPALQAAITTTGVDADTSSDEAVITRQRILKRAAGEDLLVAGAHLDFPGLFYVRKDEESFELIPELWVSHI